MEHLVLPHLDDYPLSIGLFTGVKNAIFLREQLLQGNTAFEYAFLDASVLASRTQVLAACFRAIHDTSSGRMKSRNVHSEIVFSLSANNNVRVIKTTMQSDKLLTVYQIAESFRRFGVSESTADLVAIKVGSSTEEVEKHLMSNIEGSLQALTDGNLGKLRNDARLRKIYHVDIPAQDAQKPLGWTAQAGVLGNMSLKGS